VKNPKAETRNPKEGRNPKAEGLSLEPRGLAGELLVSDDRNVLARRQCLQDSDFGFRISFGLRPSAFGFPSA
jgi:hypothetical protein